jgi:hypothetical protein
MHSSDFSKLLRAPVVAFVESPGKKFALNDALTSLGFASVRCIATKGRVHDFDLSQNGITQFSCHPYIEKLIKEVPHGCTALIVTDDDIEGEVIAKSISMLLPHRDYLRLRVRDFSKAGLQSAFDELKDKGLNAGRANGGESRRMFDAKLAAFGGSHQFARLGRVVTPLLHILDTTGDRIGGYLSRQFVGSDGCSFDAIIPLSNKEMRHSEELRVALDSLPTPVTTRVDRRCIEDPIKPLNYGEMLRSVSLALGESVDSIGQSTQKLYESGRISYPRSSSRYISDADAERLRRCASDLNISGFCESTLKNRSGSLSRSSVARGAHGAIIPMQSFKGTFSDMSDLALDDRVMALLTRHLMQCGQGGRQILTDTYNLTPEQSAWDDFLSGCRFKPIFQNVSLSLSHKRTPLPINNFSRPMGVPLAGNVGLRTSINPVPLDVQVLDCLLANNLGCPSTYSGHASRVSKTLLSKDGDLSASAKRSLAKARELVPSLLSLEKVVSMTKHLESNKERHPLVFSDMLIRAVQQPASEPLDLGLSMDL